MPDYLQRGLAPLAPDEWAAIDQTVVRTAQSVLVGRRFISLVGPFGPGVEALPNDVLSGSGGGMLDLLGHQEGETLAIGRRSFLPLPLLYKDFWVHWRDLEASPQLGVPLDVGKSATAASGVVYRRPAVTRRPVNSRNPGSSGSGSRSSGSRLRNAAS